MSIQGRSTSDTRNPPVCERVAARGGALARAAKRIASARSSRPSATRLCVLAAVMMSGFVACAHTRQISAEPLPAPEETSVLRTANADALLAATAEAATSHAVPEPAASLHVKPSGASSTNQQASAAIEKHSIPDWITARTSVWLPEVDAMGQHLALAGSAIADRDAPRARWQLDEAADALRRNGGGEGAVHDLRALAARVGQGAWPSSHAFNLMLVEANDADPAHGWGARVPYAAYVDRPLHAVRRATTSYAAGRREQAAGALRDASADLDRAARRAAIRARPALARAAVRLKRVAARLETGGADMSASLDAAAAHATAALARDHALQARAFWRDHAEAATGRALQAAALYLHESAVYAARTVDPHVIQQTRALSARLLEHAHVASSTVDSRVSALEREIRSGRQSPMS